MPNRKNLALILTGIILISLFAALFTYQPLWGKVSSSRPWSFGLDIAGGSLLTYEIDMKDVEPGDQDSVARGLRDVIERRVNFFGVSEPRVYLENADNTKRLIVELAGVKDVKLAIDEIGTTPLLDFREVEERAGTSTSTDLLGNYNFIKTDLTGRYIKNARVDFDSVTGKPQVSIEFTEEGGNIFETLTGKNIGKPLAIFLDDEPIEMPIVQGKISGGKAQITGNYSLETARALVERFNAGALPAPITLINQETISAELGSDSLSNAFRGGILGTILVIIFMLVFYKKYGLYASGALLMYIALTLAIFKVIPITLTLSGIAGFILSIGMAVDANILVFERTKEELAKGLSHVAAIEEGFKRAWSSIRDSNVSTIITSIVLYYATSSFVRGFALALLIGVLMSMFSAITITRTMLRLSLQKKLEKQ